ncbi:MAG: hypothetical protein ACHQQQ_11085 [Bacteroidota bacterium]
MKYYLLTLILIPLSLQAGEFDKGYKNCGWGISTNKLRSYLSKNEFNIHPVSSISNSDNDKDESENHGDHIDSTIRYEDELGRKITFIFCNDELNQFKIELDTWNNIDKFRDFDNEIYVKKLIAKFSREYKRYGHTFTEYSFPDLMWANNMVWQNDRIHIYLRYGAMQDGSPTYESPVYYIISRYYLNKTDKYNKMLERKDKNAKERAADSLISH